MRSSFLARSLVLLFLALVPLRIVSQGYLPTDDALRHAAKAVSGRSWNEVLVLRPEVTMDSHPGWHALLGLVHRTTGASAPQLVVVSVVALLWALLLPPALLMRRPEAWALTIAAFATFEPRILSRFASGRPFLLSAALLLLLCLLLGRSRASVLPRYAPALLALPIALVVWIHPSWYLFLLPVAACLLAGRFRLGALFAGALALGVLFAGLLYGHPLQLVWQSLLHAWLAMGTPAPPGTLAIEFLPGDGSPQLVLAALAFVAWRSRRGEWRLESGMRPLAALTLLGWLLGRLVIRFWSDWGVIALLAWMALELESTLETRLADGSMRRVALAAVAGVAAWLACTVPLAGPAPESSSPYRVLTSPGVDAALPDPGGVLYTDDPRLFFQVFYSRPSAPFRYIVGYEPALMPPSDLATFRATLAARTPASFAPWVAKMEPRDRLILRSIEGQPPLPQLDWMQVSQSVWSGRVPRDGGR